MERKMIYLDDAIRTVESFYKVNADIRRIMAFELRQLPSAQPEPCEDAVSRKAVEEMLKNGLPQRGMWEIEGDVVKQTVCETLADALMDLEKLPSVQPEILACGNGELNAQPEQRWIPCGKCIHADGKHRWCKVLDRTINEDYFCYWAEPRKEGEVE